MGGRNSSRWHFDERQITLDDCRYIDINKMTKRGMAQEGQHITGVITWSDRRTHETSSQIAWEWYASIPHESYVRFRYRVTFSGDEVDYKVRLDRTYPPYGGVRFWFICPVTSKRVTKLYHMPGDHRFLSRHAAPIYYESQMVGDIERAIHKKWKLMDKVDGTYYPERPKGMHRRTFHEILDKFDTQDMINIQMIENRFCTSMHYRKR